jgi:hypothetical protein
MRLPHDPVAEARLTRVKHFRTLLDRQPDVVSDSVLNLAGAQRLTGLEDLEDCHQEAIPGRHLAHDP